MKLVEQMSWYDFRENASKMEWTENFKPKEGEKFDYILIQDDIEKIQFAKKYLKPNSTILLFLNNRFGIRYFAGDKQNSKAFETICTENSNLYSKKEIEQILQNQGFENYKFFYPLPNYENPSVIFSDEYLPDDTDTKLLYNNCYHENTALVFQEVQALKQLTKAGEFPFFANSFIVEINPSKQPKFVSFNHSRKKEYQLVTKMYEDFVVKEMANKNAKQHMLNMQNYIQELQNHGIKIIDKVENDKIISRFVEEKTLFQKIVKMIKNNEVENACELIQKWYDFIKSKFENDKTEKLNENFQDENQVAKNLTIVKKAYIDLVLENVFLEEDEFVFFDQEWCFENLPLEFILYRAIHNLYIYNFELQAIFPKEECFKKFGLSDFVDWFEEMENVVQGMIIDAEYTKKVDSPLVIEDVKFLFDERNTLLEIREKLFKSNQEMEFTIGEQKQQIVEKDKYIEKLEGYEKDKDTKIENLQETLGLVKVDNEKKQEYIQALEEYKQEKERENQELNAIIQNLNEIIQVKDNQIQNYENMKAVKIVKKLRNIKK